MKYSRIIVVGAVCFALASPAVAQMGGQAPPQPMSPAQFAQTGIGQTVQVAVRVQRVARSTLYAELLAHETDTVSKATGKQVVVFFPDGTPIVMGQTSDVKPGAVLFIYGVLTRAGQVDAKRVVVDTKYVTVH